jgi:DNA-3-methyladenine glycosylase
MSVIIDIFYPNGLGIHDAACHAHLGRRTNRTEVMFQNGGKAYVYLCYGIHSLFNIITGPEGDPCAILIRALEPIDGIDEMRKRRLPIDKLNTLCKGPGALTKALQISQIHYGICIYT